QWPKVTETKKWGFPAFYVNEVLFLLWVEEGPVFTCLSPEKREKAIRDYRGQSFEHKGKHYEDWCLVPCKTDNELKAIEFLIRASYQAGHLK
ncbi:MAG: hypothetical protein WC655_07590, partial [Candidatus Hydrogenedentales bacterium]